jgi:hypothetical protein
MARRTGFALAAQIHHDSPLEFCRGLAGKRTKRVRRRQQEARPVAPAGRKLRHHRARQPRPQCQEPPPGLPATGAKLMQRGADIFGIGQDDFDDDAEELGDRRRPWRDDAAERRALARRAGHVMVPFAKAECASSPARRLQKRGGYKSNVPGSGCSGHTFQS